MYTKKNYYRRIISIQKLTRHLQELGLSNTRIYELHIRKRFQISKRTYDEYLGVPAKKQLEKLISR